MTFGELITASQVWPFSLALGLFFAIVALEITFTLIGFGADLGMDLSLDVDIPDAPDLPDVPDGPDLPDLPDGWHFLEWLGIGRVPYLVSVAAFLFSFGLIGLLVQDIQLETLKTALPWPLVAAGCTVVSLPVVSFLNRMLGKIWPKDVETSAVSQDSLIGHEAVVVLGQVSNNEPGQIKVRDANSTTHYALAVSDTNGEVYEQGTHVLIVSRQGPVYAVIRHPNPTTHSS